MKPQDLKLKYYHILYKDYFLIKQRGDSFIWKKLYDFPEEIPDEFESFITEEKTINHKLTHKNLEISIAKVSIDDKVVFEEFARKNQFIITDFEKSHQKSFPKPLENFLKKEFEGF